MSNWLKIADELPVSPLSGVYHTLMSLVKVLGLAGVPSTEVMEIVNAGPVRTTADIEAMTTKLWRLAKDKYNVPTDWLMQQLSKSEKKESNMSGWFKKADEMTMAAPGLPGNPGGTVPTAPSLGKPPMSEKDDVATGDDIVKDLKALIAHEKAEGEKGDKRDVKTLEDALKKVEDYVEAEKKEAKERAEKKKKEEEKGKKDEKKEGEGY